MLRHHKIEACQEAFRFEALKHLNDAKTPYQEGVASALLSLHKHLGKLQGDDLGELQDPKFFGRLYCTQLYDHIASFEELDSKFHTPANNPL